MPPFRPSLWRQTPALQRWWWFMPLGWWLSSSLMMAAAQMATQAFGAVDDRSPLAEQALAGAFLHLHRTTLGLCVAAGLACAGLWLLLGRARRRQIPLTGRTFLRWIFALAFLAAAVLAQGAWRCQPPPPPYPESAMAGIRLFLGIEQMLLRSLILMWGVMGLLLLVTPLIDFGRTWGRVRRARRGTR